MLGYQRRSIYSSHLENGSNQMFSTRYLMPNLDYNAEWLTSKTLDAVARLPNLKTLNISKFHPIKAATISIPLPFSHFKISHILIPSFVSTITSVTLISLIAPLQKLSKNCLSVRIPKASRRSRTTRK